MGSLMAGWDSPVSDPKSAKYKRNMSLTKEEIDAYWNLKKKIHEEHLQAVSPRSHVQDSRSPWETDEVEGGSLPVRSRSLPSVEERESLEKLMKKKEEEEEVAKGWWKRSNWAFLNEPPVVEQASNTYAAQYHIATAN
ncbi:hypothetical protein LINGRAHAP2_LOCUS23912 [Linum grandiflorum]